MSQEILLKIQNLSVSFGGIRAVKNIDVDVPKGKIVTLIGANGAGKSTTLRSIVGLVRLSGGKVFFEDEDITKKKTDEIVGKGITLVPEGRRIFSSLTVVENLKLGGYMRKDKLEEDIKWVYSLFPRFKERSWQMGGTLSGGEQQILAVARALMSRPKLIKYTKYIVKIKV